MIGRVIGWSVQNRLLVLLFALLVAGGGGYAVRHLPLDAIPDLSDVEVIIKTAYPGQAPQVVEDQVTYPLATAMLGVPGATAVRGYSMYGDSFVYVLFADGTDLYWARSRVLEYLNQAAARLPAQAHPTLGPDATAVGWIYQYALVDRTGGHDLAQLRSLQDWYLQYELRMVPGVAEVATVGGMVRQYQVVVDPNALRAYRLPLSLVVQTIHRSNSELGGAAIEMAEAQYRVRAAGYLHDSEDLRRLPLRYDGTSTLFLKDIAEVGIGPQMRQGIADLDGEGEVVGGIVLMRQGANALETVAAVKARLAELRSGLPQGVELVEVYDRSGLIQRSVDTLTHRLVEELGIVALVCALFLLQVRSALVVMVSLPLGILAAFILMRWQGISANIMSLGGIAIAIGAMVDAAIVMVENLHKHIEREGLTDANRWQLVQRAATEVGRPLFYSLLIVTLSFLPVLALEGQEGRMFAPLAYTKTYAMAAAAGLAISLVPVLLGLFVRGRIRPERDNPISRWLIWAYRPLLDWVLRYPRVVLLGAAVLTLSAAWPALHLGSELMPELDEGDILYMPTLFPGVAPDKARQVLQQTDRMIRSVPEVAQVFGKVGRAETATDPAPQEMIETLIRLKPRDQWRAGMTPEGLRAELDRVVRVPGLTNAWLMPINARLQMLSTGVRTPVGIKIAGPDLAVIQRLGEQIEAVVGRIAGTRSVYAERGASGRYIRMTPDLVRAAQFGLGLPDIQEIIGSAVGGMDLTEIVDGRERYPVNLRYPAHARDSLDRLQSLPIVTERGAQVPLGDVARIELIDGPDMIRTENARLNGWVLVDIDGRDLGSYVAEAKQAVTAEVSLPPGYSIAWSGAYEHWERAKARLWLVIPLTLAVILILLYLNFRESAPVFIILATLPLALMGGAWLLYLLGYHWSVATVIGFIALGGVAVEIGVVMLLYLDRALDRRRQTGRDAHTALTLEDVRAAVVEGALLRPRPVAMTKVAVIAALMPILLGEGAGAEAMQRIAAPMVGGMVSVALLTLAVIPAAYLVWRGRAVRRQHPTGPGLTTATPETC